ncbi:MAG: glycoside hydrolase [Actinomycetota bacterium]|nr:glycoside hydrolase [Actinomycetota bacterium]
MRRLVGPFAAAAAVATLAGPMAGAITDPTLTQSKRATIEDLDPSRLYSSPDLAVDPRNPRIVVASFADLRSRHCGLLRSTDAGMTWKRLDAAPSTPGYPFCLIPDDSNIQAHVAFGRTGTLYYALSGWNTQDGGSAAGTVSVLLGRSDDLGDSWQPVLVDDARGKQEAEREGVRPLTDLVVDRASGKEDVVYVTWVKQFPGATGANAKPIQAMVGVSRDGGKTFAPPIRLSEGAFTPEVLSRARTSAGSPGVATDGYIPTNFGGDRPTVTVDANGTAYAAWFSVTTSNVNPRPAPGHFLSTSTDQGRTWAAAQIAPFDTTNGRGRLKMAWTPKGGSQGSLNLAVEGNRFPDTMDYAEVFRRRSTDGGKTWTDREPLSSDQPGNGRGKYHPNVAVAPNGRVDVVWWDTRDDPGIRGNDVYYVFSDDGGATWSKNFRITDRTVDRRIGVWVFNFDMSTVPSVASADSYALFGWDDTRETPPELILQGSAAPGFGIQDIFTAAAQHAPVGASSSDTAAVIVAASLGLVAGCLILVAILVGRRVGARARPAATDVRPRTPTSVG